MALLAALAMVTDKTGLATTSSSSYEQPYYLGRRYLSLDHLSKPGVVEHDHRRQSREALDLGSAPMARADCYARGRKFAGVAPGRWNRWADDAFIIDSRRSGEPRPRSPTRLGG